MKLALAMITLAAGLSLVANAQQTAWGQCGGHAWSGPTSCVSGYACRYQNYYYSQCLPDDATTMSSSTKTSLSRTSSTSTGHLTTVSPSTTRRSTSFLTTTTSSAIPTGSTVEYLISFGDSYSQTGFDASLGLPSASNPLGNPSLPGWTTSGGLNWIGYYISRFNSTPVYSYNFASGGATTDAELVKPFAPTVLSFVDQVDLYLENARKPGFVKWQAANSLFAIWIGVNDVGNAWYLSNYATLLGQIMDQYMAQTQALYKSGARRFVFLTVPPIHLSPAVQVQGDSTVKAEAVAVKQYNGALRSRVAAFATANDDAKTYLVDTTTPFLEATQNPQKYGATNATCFDASGTKCLWWNDYHPGLAIHQLVAQALSKTLQGP